jgi:hypothetical protein
VNFQKPQVSILTKKRKNNSRVTRQVIRYENCVVFKAPTFSLKDNTWHHYAIVCPDEDPHNIKVYFDGKELRGGRVVGDFLINTGKSHMVIGGKFEGYLSSIQVFGDILTSNQIERMANAIN